MAFLLTSFMTVWYRLENARRDRVSSEQAGRPESSHEARLAEREMADDAPFFRYSA